MFRVPQVFHMARDDADEPESHCSYAKVEAVSVPSVAPGLIKVGTWCIGMFLFHKINNFFVRWLDL